MPRFFINAPLESDTYIMEGENARHMIKSLRMREGEELTLCDGIGTDYFCVLEEILGDTANVKILSKSHSVSEPKAKVYLYQCLPKSDKLDTLIQKSVELGVFEIVPVMSSRCVATVKGKESKKGERWNKISLEAAKQSGRGIIPAVCEPVKFQTAIKTAVGLKILFYEGGGESLKELLKGKEEEISIFVGPEGGFSKEEVEAAKKNGFRTATLGKRILRTETAPLAALSIIMYERES